MYLTVDEIVDSVKGFSLAKDGSKSGVFSKHIQIMIDDETAMVNGLLSHRYVVPIDKDNEDTKNAFNIVKSIVRYRVLCRLELFLNLQGEENSSQAIVDAMKISSMYKEASRKLLKGELLLDNVPLVDNIIASNFPESRFSNDRPNW